MANNRYYKPFIKRNNYAVKFTDGSVKNLSLSHEELRLLIASQTIPRVRGVVCNNKGVC